MVLMDVSHYAEVGAVREALGDLVGPDTAKLRVIGPRRAEIELTSKLSPGSLQDRLVQMRFAGFELEPVQVTVDRVELRVARVPDAVAPEQLPGARDPGP